MSWKIAILVALITAVITAIVTAPVADHVTIKLRVSNFEGGRGYLVAFLVVLAAVGGALIGLGASRWVGAVEWGQFWKAQGCALLVSQVALFGIAGLFLLSIPRTLLLEGELIALDFEITVPDALLPDTLDMDAIRMSLYANRDDNSYVDLDTTRFVRNSTQLLIPGEAALNSISGTRMLSLIMDDGTSYTLDMPLRPLPTTEDMAWSKPYPMRLSVVQGTTYEYTEVTVRYRVVKKGQPTE